MQRRPRSTPNAILNSSRNHHQNQVFEVTLDEEDEKTSVRQQQLGKTKSYVPQILSKRESGVTTSDNSKISLHDKENIPEKQESRKQCISSSVLNQRLSSNLSGQGEILSKLDSLKNYQTNGTSALFENLDANIKEFQQLLSCNLRIIPQNSIENIGPQNDSKILEISRLSLKLEESKFCTEGDPSELKILREFETKASGVRAYETKAPEVTQIQEFEESAIDVEDQDSKFIRPFIVTSNNESYLTEPRDQRQRREFSDQPKRQQTEESPSRSQIYFLDVDPNPANKIFETFLEDYQTIILAFRKILPRFEAKSHILRYLATHETLGYEFLYSVMLDLKELEKSALLADHRASTREEILKEQIAEVIKVNEKCSNENIELKRKIEKLLDKNGNQSMSGLDISKTGGNHVKYMKGHYQALLMKTNEFYGQKIEMLKQCLLSKDKHAAMKLTIDNVFEDLAEEMGVQGVQDGLRENLKKLKELHSSIGHIWVGKFSLPFEKLETKSTQFLKTLDTRKTTDMNSTGPLTTRPQEILEFDKNQEDEVTQESQDHIVLLGPETRLNSSEYEQKSLEIFLKNKETQLNLVRKKEQVYQNLIYSLTQELRAANKTNQEPLGACCETQKSEIES